MPGRKEGRKEGCIHTGSLHRNKFGQNITLFSGNGKEKIGSQLPKQVVHTIRYDTIRCAVVVAVMDGRSGCHVIVDDVDDTSSLVGVVTHTQTTSATTTHTYTPVALHGHAHARTHTPAALVGSLEHCCEWRPQWGLVSGPKAWPRIPSHSSWNPFGAAMTLSFCAVAAVCRRRGPHRCPRRPTRCYSWTLPTWCRRRRRCHKNHGRGFRRRCRNRRQPPPEIHICVGHTVA